MAGVWGMHPEKNLSGGRAGHITYQDLRNQALVRVMEMTAEKAHVWFDPEGDFLEVTFSSAEGEWMDTEDERVMTKVDDKGDVIAFHILSVSTLKGKKVAPFEADLTPKSTTRVRKIKPS